MHEKKDLRVRAVVKFGAAVVVLAVVLHFAMVGLFGAFRRAEERADQPRHPLAPSPAVPPAPRLEVAPRAEIDALRREEKALLESYGWVDRANGRVRIPVARALDLLEKKGLPVRAGALPAD